MKVVLGSSSAARKQILTKMGYEFITQSPNIDEYAIRDPDPVAMTLKIAKAKADVIVKNVSEPCLVITSDQVIMCNGTVREKPKDVTEAKQFLQSYRTHPAEAICGVVVTNTATGKQVSGVGKATQYFSASLPDSKIEELIAEGTVMWCAGGFAVELMEGFLGERIGEIECVMGLPRALTDQLLNEARE